MHGLLIGGLVGLFALARFGVSFRAFGLALLGGTLAGGTSYLLWIAEEKGLPEHLFGSFRRQSEDEYSYQQSLVMQGRIDAALTSYEALIAASPNAIEARIRAAELYARRPQTAQRAAELYREVLRVGSASLPLNREAYITNRLVDVLLGPLGDHAAAIVELRRLVARHPNTMVAREALARLHENARK